MERSTPAARAALELAEHMEQRGAELALFGGVARVSGGVHPSFGWSLAWLLSHRVAIEGSGSWLDEPGVDGFAAIIGPRIYLNTGGRAVTFLDPTCKSP